MTLSEDKYLTIAADLMEEWNGPIPLTGNGVEKWQAGRDAIAQTLKWFDERSVSSLAGLDCCRSEVKAQPNRSSDLREWLLCAEALAEKLRSIRNWPEDNEELERYEYLRARLNSGDVSPIKPMSPIGETT